MNCTILEWVITVVMGCLGLLILAAVFAVLALVKEHLNL